MACDVYVDELDINPFFRALQTRFEDVYAVAQERCYTICIPQTSTIHGTDINKDFLETHILKPSPYFKGQLLTIHSGKSRTVSLSEDGCTVTTEDGFPSRVGIKVISEELAYNKDYEQYKILIIDKPLDPKFENSSAEGNNQTSSQQCISLEECRKFLQSCPEMSKALDRVDQSMRMFNSSYMVLPEYLHDAATRLGDISSEGVEMCVKCAGRQRATDVLWKDALVSAMESYVMSGVYNKVFDVVSQHHAADDLRVERKCREQLRVITHESLGIPSRFACPLPKAVECVNQLDGLTTPREKLYCLKSVMDSVSDEIAAHLSRDVPPHLMPAVDKPCLTSDDLIPILVRVIGQSNCRHLQSDIVYMETFSWASSAKDMDDLSFCLVTFKAAVQYILTTEFGHLSFKPAPKKQLSGGQMSPDRLSPAFDHLSMADGVRGDKSPRFSPGPRSSPNFPYTTVTPTQGGERMERQRLRIAQVLQDTVQPPDDHRKEKEQHKVSSIFGGQMNVSAALETSSKSKATPELGDFLSSLQDDFDTPFGKLN